MTSFLSSIRSFLMKRYSGEMIDTHIHVITPAYRQALEDNGGDPSGWATPSWTLEECLDFCNVIESSFSVLSVTAPGPAIVGSGPEGRALCRKMNEEVWQTCEKQPTRFGYFASLPHFDDQQGVLEEIETIFAREKTANGVVVMSSYGQRLVGDKAYRPIWDALNRHKALVFLHPGHMVVNPEKINDSLPQPVIDYPQATTRAAASLLWSGVMTECQQLDVILSHAGGTLPFLATRLVGSLVNRQIASQSSINLLQARSAIKRFYYDLALSTSEAQLRALLSTADHNRILFGSDFPYAPKIGIYAGMIQLAQFARREEGNPVQSTKLQANGYALLHSHKLANCHLPIEGKNDTRANTGFASEQALNEAMQREESKL